MANRYLKEFCRSIIHCFKSSFLRIRTGKYIEIIEDQYRRRGFSGAIGCFDCRGSEWKNCPVAWQGAFKGKDKVPQVRMEVIADESLRIWHLLFCQPGSRNDLDILDASPLFHQTRFDHYPSTKPWINIDQFEIDWHYILTDGIYPRWKMFVQSYRDPKKREERSFSKHQEGVRKSVERVFGVLFQRFNILYMPCRLWRKSSMRDVVTACAILHNMVVEYRRATYVSQIRAPGIFSQQVPTFLERIQRPTTLI